RLQRFLVRMSPERGRVHDPVTPILFRWLPDRVEVEVVAGLFRRPHDQFRRLPELVDDLTRGRGGLTPHHRRAGDPLLARLPGEQVPPVRQRSAKQFGDPAHRLRKRCPACLVSAFPPDAPATVLLVYVATPTARP